MVLYLSNSACQAVSLTGGTTPVTGFHSTIESPDSVSRVAPPTIKVTTISAATVHNHSPMAWWRIAGGGKVRVMTSFACWCRADHIVIPKAVAIVPAVS